MSECMACAALRLAWYATAKRIQPEFGGTRQSEPVLDAILAERESPVYQAALEVYRNHRLECPACKLRQAGENV